MLRITQHCWPVIPSRSRDRLRWMPRRPRVFVEGGTYHVNTRLVGGLLDLNGIAIVVPQSGARHLSDVISGTVRRAWRCTEHPYVMILPSASTFNLQ